VPVQKACPLYPLEYGVSPLAALLTGRTFRNEVYGQPAWRFH
jgi:hypothetical protein